MGRFDPPQPSDVLNRQSLARIESALSALVDQMVTLGNLPAPQVNVAAPNVTMPNVEVPTEPMVNAIGRLLEEIAAQRPLEAPTVNVSSPDVVVDFAPFIDAQEEHRLAMAALVDKVRNLTQSNKSHFDGRVLDDRGNRVNPAQQETLEQIATALGAPSGLGNDTLLDYDVRTDTNPVYVGSADFGTATSASEWTVKKLLYDGDDRLIQAREKVDIKWDDRTTAF